MRQIKDREKFMNELAKNIDHVFVVKTQRYVTGETEIECLSVTDRFDISTIEFRIYDAGIEVRTKGAFVCAIPFNIYENKTQLFMGVTRILTNAGF